MNINTNVDYDSIIDHILLSENRTAEKNYIEGTEKSSENSNHEGFQAGYQKGYDIGVEIGFYNGILTALQKLQKAKIIVLSDRELNNLQKLSNLIGLFPQINNKNINIVDQHNEIKGLYKKFCINLKIKDLDKTLFHFSKWNN